MHLDNENCDLLILKSGLRYQQQNTPWNSVKNMAMVTAGGAIVVKLTKPHGIMAKQNALVD